MFFFAKNSPRILSEMLSHFQNPHKNSFWESVKDFLRNAFSDSSGKSEVGPENPLENLRKLSAEMTLGVLKIYQGFFPPGILSKTFLRHSLINLSMNFISNSLMWSMSNFFRNSFKVWLKEIS